MDPLLQGYLIVGGSMFLITLMLFNFASKGYLMKILIVRSSRGLKKLILLKGKDGWYPTTGKVEGESLVWKDRETKLFAKNQVPKRVKIEEGMFFQIFGCDVVKINEADGTIINPDNSKVSGFDPMLEETYIMRALNKPGDEDKKFLLLVIILIVGVVCLFATIFVAIQVLKLNGNVQALSAAFEATKNHVVQGAAAV